MPKVTISILAYGAVDHSIACLKSVLDHSAGHDYELILTDNGSTDGTAEFFREVQSLLPEGRVMVVTNEVNKGFVEPNRLALTIARGQYFVMLNNDAKVPPGWLDHLLRPFDRFPRAALTGPEGSCCELTPQFYGVPGRNLDYLEGSCLCGKSDILRRHGLFSDYLKFAYHEDSDLSLRMQELGYSIHRAPFRIQHVRNVTAQNVPEVEQYQESNRNVMLSRWSGWRHARKFNYPVIVRRRASAGDVLLASAIVKALAERCPRSIILVETDFKPIFVGNPRVVRISNRLPAIRGARVIDLDMVYENRPGQHIITAYSEAAHLGPIGLRTEFFESNLCIKHAETMLMGGLWIAIHAGPTTWEGKNWKEAKWRALIEQLVSDGWKVLLVGNQGYDLPNHLDLRGKTRVHELAGYLKVCHLFCGVDSFPMHLAQAIGTPIVPLFGVTSPKFILTLGSPAYPVESNASHEFTGFRHRTSGATHVAVTSNPMDTISVDQVMDAIQMARNTREVAAV